VALFVALMSARTTTLAARGLAAVDALSGGIRGGFLCGAVISLFAVACVFFVQKPAGPLGGRPVTRARGALMRRT
jgi:MFS transporter, DHA2 family, lincomycin resistance protein